MDGGTKLNLCVMVSGGLGLKALMHLVEGKDQVVCVFTDSGSHSIIELCDEHSIPCFKGNPRNGKGKTFIEKYNVDVLASINYLFLIEKDLIEYPKGLAFNIHGSLLPKYRGRTPHVWAIINGETKTGITAHRIDADCDTGDIIHQVEVPIEQNDTGAVILKKFEELYIPMIDNVLDSFRKDSVTYRKQNDQEATFFGKRTPESGHIKWEWTQEQIRNWVRAQAFPYPGAFVWLNGQKITIDRVEKSTFKPVVKGSIGQLYRFEDDWYVLCQDGTVRLSEVRTNSELLSENKILE